MPASILWNRKPLPQNLLAPLPLTAVRAQGWLRDRIEIEAADTFDDRLARACVLHDAALMDAAQAEGRALLQTPVPTRDMVRAYPRYHGVTSDKEVALYLLRYLRDLRDRLDAGETLPAREAADSGDLLLAALWLYNMTGQKALLELCHQLKAQAPDWMSTFHIFAQTRPVREVPAQDTDAYWRAHGPTIAAALKVPALQALFEGGLKNETGFEVGMQKLQRHHGAAHGLFSADPMLAGANPSRGVDPAVVTELLYTLRVQLWAQADATVGDRLEQLVYGPLLALRGAQAANQLAEGDGPATGLAQAAGDLWMATADDGLAAIVYAPCEVRWRVGGQAVRISVEGDYPYGETVRITLRTKAPVTFPLRLRIPAWAEGASITLPDGEILWPATGAFAQVSRPWQDGDTLVLTLPLAVRTEGLYHQTLAVRRGPLVYALPVEDGVPWNLALPEGAVFDEDRQAGIPVLWTDAVVVPGWHASGDAPAAPPVAPDEWGQTLRVALVPYGGTTRRIAQFPHVPAKALSNKKEETP